MIFKKFNLSRQAGPWIAGLTIAAMSGISAWSKNSPKETAAEASFYPPGEKPLLAQPLKKNEPIQLNLARGEFASVAFTLPAGDPKAAISSATLKWTSESRPGLDLRSYWFGVQRFSQSSFHVRPPAGEVAEILAPNSWLALKTFHPPSENTPTHPMYLLEFQAQSNARPGLYAGEIEIEVGGRKITQSIQLHQFSYALPTHLELASSFGFSPWAVLKKHYGGWNAAELELYQRYVELALDHRVDLHKIYMKFPEAGAKDLLAEGPVAAQTFLGQIQTFFEKGSSASGFHLGTTDLPVPEERKAARPEDEGFWKALDFSVVTHHLEAKSFVYFKDEPQPNELVGLGERLKKIRKWAPHLRFLMTHHYRDSLDGGVTLWCVNLFLWEKSGEPTPEFYRLRQTQKGEELWFYVGCNSHGCTGAEDPGNPDLVTDRASAYARALPWVAVRYGATGVLYYDTIYGYNHGDSQSPWKDSFQFTGYGEGNLFYPCTPALGGCAEPKVLPSYRLKAFRDGMQDSQILLAAKARGAPVDAWVKELVPSARQFPHSVASFEKVKTQALEALEATLAPPTEVKKP